LPFWGLFHRFLISLFQWRPRQELQV
jgi:hypothetical protein